MRWVYGDVPRHAVCPDRSHLSMGWLANERVQREGVSKRSTLSYLATRNRDRYEQFDQGRCLYKSVFQHSRVL